VLPDGRTFKVGSGFSNAERAKPPPIGSIITFKYQELSTGGIPRFPVFVRIRPDAIWPPASGWPPKHHRSDD
jgi:DNA ligase-1